MGFVFTCQMVDLFNLVKIIFSCLSLMEFYSLFLETEKGKGTSRSVDSWLFGHRVFSLLFVCVTLFITCTAECIIRVSSRTRQNAWHSCINISIRLYLEQCFIASHMAAIVLFAYPRSLLFFVVFPGPRVCFLMNIAVFDKLFSLVLFCNNNAYHNEELL